MPQELVTWTETDLWGATRRHEMRRASEAAEAVKEFSRRGFVHLYDSTRVQVLASRAEGTVLIVEKQ
jgi:hypothetical protein